VWLGRRVRGGAGEHAAVALRLCQPDHGLAEAESRPGRGDCGQGGEAGRADRVCGGGLAWGRDAEHCPLQLQLQRLVQLGELVDVCELNERDMAWFFN